jgi:hypothetical protein
MNLRAAILLFLLPTVAFGSEAWFRRDADEVRWLLVIDGGHFLVESGDLSGKRIKVEGVASDAGSSIIFQDAASSASTSIVHGKRFLKKKVGDILYLVEEQREKEFAECVDEKEEFLRHMFLGNFLHQIAKPKPEKTEANSEGRVTQQPSHNPG